MYLVYIHPLFEYACEVWDNCGIGYFPHFILKINWSFLRYLRSDNFSQPVSTYKYSDFVKMGKAVTILAASKNGDNLIVPFCRLSITNSSFIPSIVKEWNKFDIAIRKLDSLSKFKNAIRINSQSKFYIKN
jgi:hypothetical protein